MRMFFTERRNADVTIMTGNSSSRQEQTQKHHNLSRLNHPTGLAEFPWEIKE